MFPLKCPVFGRHVAGAGIFHDFSLLIGHSSLPWSTTVSFCVENLKAVFSWWFPLRFYFCVLIHQPLLEESVDQMHVSAQLYETAAHVLCVSLYMFCSIWTTAAEVCDMYICGGWIRWAVSASLSVKCQDLMLSHIKSKPVKRQHLETTFSSNANGITESRGTIFPD